MESIRKDKKSANLKDLRTNVKNLILWSIKTKNLIVDEQDTPLYGVTLSDIKLKKKNEEEVYINDDEVFKRVRRGNCIISYVENNQEIQNFARKGLPKFFDYKIKYKKNKKDDIRIKQKVLEDVHNGYKSGNKFYVYLTYKANGENLQISYENNLKVWIVASKNVTVLIRNREDIDWYKFKSKNADKYVYCLEFAEFWLQILEEKILSQGRFEEFIKDITGFTLVGENVGDPAHQHIKIYDKKDIIFYALVKNDSDQLCLPLNQSFEILTKYNFTFVDVVRSEVLHTYEEFLDHMKFLYNDILNKDVEQAGEGAVAYFSQIDIYDNSEEIVSMGKLKTFDYRFLRKLREKLKGMYKNPNPNNILKNIERECKEILGEEGDDVDLTEYLKFGEFVINFFINFTAKTNFSDQYASFINEMKILYNKKKNNELDIDANLIKKIQIKFTKNSDGTYLKENLDNEINILSNNSNQMIVKELDKKPRKNRSTKNTKKDVINLENDTKINLHNNFDKNKFKKGYVYLLLNLGLVASGKSTLLKFIQEIVNKDYEQQINFIYLSSDEFRKLIVDDYMKANPKVTFETAFDAVENKSREGFNNELKKLLRHKKRSDKINLFFIDKNFTLDTAEKVYKMLDIYANIQMILFHPKISTSINEGNLIYPFSWSYFIQAFHRLKSRKNHENLDYEKCPHAHYILLSFLSLFRGETEFEISDSEYNISLHSICFTDEKDLKVNDELIKLFKQIMSYIGKKPFNKEHIQFYDDNITKFFANIEENYPINLFQDTRDVMYYEIKEFLKNKI